MLSLLILNFDVEPDDESDDSNNDLIMIKIRK